MERDPQQGQVQRRDERPRAERAAPTSDESPLVPARETAETARGSVRPVSALQRSLGNREFGIVARRARDGVGVFKGLVVGGNRLAVQRHSIPPDREGEGEEDEEIVTVQRQAEWGRDVQRAIGDGHDLTSPRFSGNEVLEGAYDNERLISWGRNGTGQHVALVQESLVSQGFPLPKYGPDGHWGGETDKAVRQFQKTHGASADGIIGPTTMELLDRHDNAGGGGGGGGGGGKTLPPPIKIPTQAEKEFDAYVKHGPRTKKNFVPDTQDNFGKWDATYDPGHKLLTADMRVKFTFPDAPLPATATTPEEQAEKKAIEELHEAYVTNFVTQVHNGWSGKYTFRNIREPQDVWGKLNPVEVKLNVTPVKSGQHYTVKGHFTTEGRANVSSNATSQVELFKGDLDPTTQGFTGEASIGADELIRLKKNLPKIHFAPNSADLEQRFVEDLVFVGDYLRRMNLPKFNVEIVGHVGADDPADPAAAALLAEQRAATVAKRLKDAGVTNHAITTKTVPVPGGDGTWRKTDFNPSVDKGFSNVQDTTLHEFGHMLGLDDEYVYTDDKGKITDTRTKTSQRKWMRMMLGDPAYGKGKENRYADEVTSLDKKTQAGSASVMHAGNDVRPYHYVTFWQGLVATSEFGAAQPAPKFTFKDWKLNA